MLGGSVIQASLGVSAYNLSLFSCIMLMGRVQLAPGFIDELGNL